MKPWLERILLIGVLVAGALAISRWGKKESFQTAPVQAESCNYINSERAWFQDKIQAVRAMVQDMSGALYATIRIKNENMRFQYANWEGNAALTTQLGGKCTEKDTSPECILLATADSNIAKYAQLGGPDLLETAVIRLNDLEVRLTNDLRRLNNQADIIGCPPTALSRFTRAFNVQKDVSYLDTILLRDKLRELSPYYIDPTLLNVLLWYLIDDPRFLQRVRTVHAQTQYVNDNIDTYWSISKGINSASALDNYANTNFTETQKGAFKTYDTAKAAASGNFACGLRGGNAALMQRQQQTLPNNTTYTRYTWVSDGVELPESETTGRAFQSPSAYSNMYN
jgi:hypothetical protein